MIARSIFSGIPDSFHRQGCYGYVHAMQHFLPLLQTFFRHCRFLETHGYARSGLDLICITESRECKHTSEKRSEINTANYMMSNALYGKRVVIVDDLLTSGTSLLEYAHNLERAGAKVEGAVFLARTFQMPSPARVKRLVWKRHLLARIWRKQAGYFL